MTENQRDYLADLALKKGVRLSDTENWSPAHASKEIERLKQLPDAAFDEITERQIKKINELVQNVLNNLDMWGFNRGDG